MAKLLPIHRPKSILKEKFLLAGILLFCLVFSFLIWQKLFFIQQSHFTDLAAALLQGKLALVPPVKYSAWQDTAFFQGKYYVYFGPIPALLLLPCVALFGSGFNQQVLSILLVAVNFYLLFRLAKKLGLSTLDACWLSIALVFGSVLTFVSLVNISAYLVQVVGFTLLLLAVYEFLNQKRYWLVGILLALAGMTRPSLYFGASFFILTIAFSQQSGKTLKLMSFLLPVIFSLGILGGYNFARFGDILNGGYSYNTTWPPGMKEAVEFGLFSPRHILGNLYFLFFKGPDPVRISDLSYVLKAPFLKASEWGMGIFYTSPIFLYLAQLKIKDRLVQYLLAGVVIGLLPALTYAGIGLWQYGYRYAVDIYPFLLVLLCLVFKERGVPNLAKVLIVYSLIFNFYLMGSPWGVYPVNF
ncbi:hypothetical protein M1563_01405 [Patescibacteria group bacterium]|nr:hypothetical protein [Patescibacteria group bacterium]